jgi:hypothetical protein
MNYRLRWHATNTDSVIRRVMAHIVLAKNDLISTAKSSESLVLRKRMLSTS